MDALLSGVDILCFDEFHVHDVGDGMFIAKLLRTAAQRRVPLVVTSNYPPDKLLPNRLWHDHFVPTIGVIKEMMDIMEIDGDTDFRRSPVAGSAAPRPSGSSGLESFSRGKIITPGTPAQLGAFGLFPPAKSQERILTPTTQRLTVKAADDMLWVSFTELCGGLMSTADYLALAEDYGTWVIDGVPSPTLESTGGSAPAWQRFNNVVDVLYDQDITLFLVGHGPLDWDLARDPAHRTSTQPVDLARIASRLSLLGRVEDSTPFEEVEAGGS
ncbi:cell division protein ZapE [Arthrobacter sp. 2MCAF14]|uniref:cell division protein ZapE n=1 Tax=Arthrobacter sp. 2MCAF14 TaxID=3232982 RepID=UPI003F8D9CA0